MDYSKPTKDLSIYATEVVRMLDGGGKFVAAGVTGRLYTVWRDSEWWGSLPVEVFHELTKAGLLTKSGQLKRTPKTRDRIEAIMGRA